MIKLICVLQIEGRPASFLELHNKSETKEEALKKIPGIGGAVENWILKKVGASKFQDNIQAVAAGGNHKARRRLWGWLKKFL